MGSIRIVPGVSGSDVHHVSDHVRQLEREDFLRMYESVDEGIAHCCSVSEQVYTGYLDDTPIAIFGISYPTPEKLRAPWLLLTEEATEHPVPVARTARKVADQWVKLEGKLYNLVPSDDEDAIKLLRFCGFTVHEKPQPQNGHPCYPFEREGANACV